MAEIIRYIKHRRDTIANWTANNPVLLEGQLGIELDGLATTPKFKIGDGTTAWNSLPYSNSSAQTFAQTLATGNTSGANNAVMDDDYYVGLGTSGTNRGKIYRDSAGAKIVFEHGTTGDYLAFGDLFGTLLKAPVGAIYSDGVGNAVGLNWNESANQIQSFNLNGGWTITTNESQVYHDTKVSFSAPTIEAIGNILLNGASYLDSVATAGTDTLTIGGTNADVINIGRSGATVNILGTALYEYSANQYVLDKLITLNYNGAVASGAGVGFEIEENSVITGYFKTNATRNGYEMLTPAVAYKATLSLASLTADRTFTYPDSSGTFALTASPTFTGNVTLNSNVIFTPTVNSSLSGANQRIASHTTANSIFTNAGLTSIASINNGGVSGGHTICVTNETGASITIVNNYASASAGEKIYTGVSGDQILPNHASIWFQYDATGSCWVAISGGLIPVATGLSGLGSGVADFLATPYDNLDFMIFQTMYNY